MAAQVAEMSCSKRLLTLCARNTWPARGLSNSMASMNSPVTITFFFMPV